jgi:cytochrome c oxidase cbb3-type subunit I
VKDRSPVGFNPFWLMAALFVTAGLFFAVLRGLSAVPAVPAPINLNWIRVHLITIGTVTQMIFATLPGYVAGKWGLPGRSAGETWLQWGLLNGGFLLIIIGMAGMENWTATIGASLVFTAVWRLFTGIVGAWRLSGRPVRESLRFYLTAPLYLLYGIVMAAGLIWAWPAPGGRPGTLEAHVHANVWGFAALVVAGILFDLFPALTGGPMARPRWIGRTFWLLNTGAAALVVGPYINVHPVTVAGLLVYAVGTVTLVLNLILTMRANRAVSPAALHLVLAYLWMIVPAFFAPFIVFAPNLVPAAAIETAATQGLINGWALGVVMGALPTVLRSRTGARHGAPPFGADMPKVRGCWLTVAALNLGVALVWATGPLANRLPTLPPMLAGYGLIAVAWVPFLRQVWGEVAALGQVAA